VEVKSELQPYQNRRELKRMEDSSTIDKSQLQSIIDSEEERGERGR
jgi:hypothetical protein